MNLTLTLPDGTTVPDARYPARVSGGGQKLEFMIAKKWVAVTIQPPNAPPEYSDGALYFGKKP